MSDHLQLGRTIPEREWFRLKGTLYDSIEAFKGMYAAKTEGAALMIPYGPSADLAAYRAATEGGAGAVAAQRQRVKTWDAQIAATLTTRLRGTPHAVVLTGIVYPTSGKEILDRLDELMHQPENGRAMFRFAKSQLLGDPASGIQLKYPRARGQQAEGWKGSYMEKYDHVVAMSQWHLPYGGGQLLINDLGPKSAFITAIKKAAQDRHPSTFRTKDINRVFRQLLNDEAPYNGLNHRDSVETALNFLVDAEKDAVDTSEALGEQLYPLHQHRWNDSSQKPGDGRGIAKKFERNRGGKGRSSGGKGRTHNNDRRGRGSSNRRDFRRGRAEGHQHRQQSSKSASDCRYLYLDRCPHGTRCSYRHVPRKRGGAPPLCAICDGKHEVSTCPSLRKSRNYLNSGGFAAFSEELDQQLEIKSLKGDIEMMKEILGRNSDHDFSGTFALTHPSPVNFHDDACAQTEHSPTMSVLTHATATTTGTKQATRSETNSGPDVAKSKPALKTGDRQATESLRNIVDLAYATSVSSSTDIIVDSGATRTYTYRQSNLYGYRSLSYKNVHPKHTVVDASGTKHRVCGYGSLQLLDKFGNMYEHRGVGWCPTLKVNLLSTTSLRSEGNTITSPSNKDTYITTSHGDKLTTTHRHGLDWLKIKPRTESALAGMKVVRLPVSTKAKALLRSAPKAMLQDTVAVTKPKPTVTTGTLKPTTEPAIDAQQTLLNQLKLKSTPEGLKRQVRMKLAELSTYTTATAHTDDYLKAHDLFGHRSPRITAQLAKQYGIKLSRTAQIFCHACNKGGAKRQPRIRKAKHALDLPPFHSQQIDISGPWTPSEVDGYTYLLGAICRTTRTTYVYGMKSLADVRTQLRRHLEVCTNLSEDKQEEWKSKDMHLPSKLLETTIGTFHPQTGRYHVQTDSHSVFVGQLTQDLFKEFKVVHTQSPPYVQNKNGLIERWFGTAARTQAIMLQARDLPKSYWFWAFLYATHLGDLTPHAALSNKSPYEMRNGTRAPSIKHLKPFGCTAYVLNQKKKHKQDASSFRGQYIGHHQSSRSHMIYNLETKRIMKSLDVTFDLHVPKNVLTGVTKLNNEPEGEIAFEDYIYDEQDDDGETPQPIEENTLEIEDSIDPQPCPSPEFAQHHPDATMNEPVVVDQYTIDVGPGGHVNALFDPHGENRAHAMTAPQDVHAATEFKSLTEACASTHGEAFRQASDKEWKQLIDMGAVKEIWLSDIAKDHYVHRSSQIFKVKFDAQGNPKRHKARSCIDGRTFVQDVHYDHKESPTPQHTTIRLLIATAAQHGYPLYDFDITGAFLTTTRGSVAYAHYPHDQRQYLQHNGKLDEKVLQVDGNWYGSPDGSYLWYMHWSKTMAELNFTKSRLDPCLWTRGSGKNLVFLCCYIDDGIFWAASPEAARQTIDDIQSHFGSIGAAHASFFLGFNILQTPKTPEAGIYVTHQSLIEKSTKKFAHLQTKPHDTPMACGQKISKGDKLSPTDKPINYPYRQVVGYSGYISQVTRLDTAHTTSMLARVQAAPAAKHAAAATRLLGYLHHTRQLGAHYKFNADAKLAGYSDSSWQDIPAYCDCADCMPNGQVPDDVQVMDTSTTEGSHPSTASAVGDKRSSTTAQLDTDQTADTSQTKRLKVDVQGTNKNDSRASSWGGIITFGGAPVWWRSAVTKNKPSSTHEAELQALFETAKAVRNIRWLLSELHFPQGTVPIYCDNAGTVISCSKISIPSRSRHIQRQFFNVRDWQKEKDISVLDIDTSDELADLTTKALPRIQHKHLLESLLVTAPDVHTHIM